MVIDRTINLVAGSTPQSFTMNLPQAGAKIRGILVDNGNNAGVQVSIYRGVTIGVDAPYVVLPGYLRAIPYRETDRITVTFSGSPATVGTIYIAISSDPFVACDTAVVSATLSGPVAISGTVTTKSDGSPVPITASTPVPVDASAGGAVTVSGAGGTSVPIRVGTGGKLPVDGSGVTQPISAASTLPVQGVVGGTKIPVDGSGVTQPISAATALPVDASAGGPVAIAGSVPVTIAAAVTVKGNAGTSGTSITVVGGTGTPVGISAIADLPIKTGSGGAIKTDGSAVTQPISAAATLPNQAVSDYPAGASPFQKSGNAQFAAGIIVLGTFSMSAGTNLYIVTFAVRGLKAQKIVWNVSGQTSGQAPHGIGDANLIFYPAFEMLFTAITLTLQLNTADVPIGTMNVAYSVSGYIV